MKQTGCGRVLWLFDGNVERDSWNTNPVVVSLLIGRIYHILTRCQKLSRASFASVQARGCVMDESSFQGAGSERRLGTPRVPFAPFLAPF